MIRTSLARTAKFLIDHRGEAADEKLAPESDADWSAQIEATDWGPVRRVLPPVAVAGAEMQWALPARALGTARARLARIRGMIAKTHPENPWRYRLRWPPMRRIIRLSLGFYALQPGYEKFRNREHPAGFQ